jgi:hypothetical protein
VVNPQSISALDIRGIPISSQVDSSIDVLIEKAKECLKDWAGPLKVALPEANFWLERRNILGVAEEQVQIKDISEIKPDSKINIELEFKAEALTYKLIIRTVVTPNGVFQLRHPELTDIYYPHSSSIGWDAIKAFAIRNAVPLAGLTLSLFNTALSLMRLRMP